LLCDIEARKADGSGGDVIDNGEGCAEIEGFGFGDWAGLRTL